MEEKRSAGRIGTSDGFIMSAIIEKLRSAGVTPVIRTSTEKSARRAIEVLGAEGFAVFEVTLTTPGALAIIAELANRREILVGAGTILSARQGEQALAAGAEFAVSPAFIPGLAELCREAGAPLALGAATPTEVLRAHEAGADFVKIFPARQLGGPGFIRALRSIYPQIAFMPTGGIDPPDILPYFAAGAACLGMGGNLVNDAALDAGDEGVIREAARAVLAEVAKR